MYELNNPEWFYITGRGKVASYGAGRVPEGLENPKQLLHCTVLIDGSHYLVTGVEMFSVGWKQYNKPFGLLVRPLDNVTAQGVVW